MIQDAYDGKRLRTSRYSFKARWALGGSWLKIKQGWDPTRQCRREKTRWILRSKLPLCKAMCFQPPCIDLVIMISQPFEFNDAKNWATGFPVRSHFFTFGGSLSFPESPEEKCGRSHFVLMSSLQMRRFFDDISNSHVFFILQAVLMDGWMDGWKDACMDGWMDAWMDG